jgi:hypothetical protein
MSNQQDKIQQIADTLAQDLVDDKTDPNEVASALIVLRECGDGAYFFRFLDTVVKDGRAVVRSGRTLDYYRSIRSACNTHLKPYQNKPQVMAEILGWAVRLMRYYRVEKWQTQSSSRMTVTPTRQQQPPSSSAPVPPPMSSPLEKPSALPPEPELDKPASEADIKKGMYVQGQVKKVEDTRVVVDIMGKEATLLHANIVPDKYRQRPDIYFKPGAFVKVWVLGRNKKERLQVTMKRPQHCAQGAEQKSRR